MAAARDSQQNGENQLADDPQLRGGITGAASGIGFAIAKAMNYASPAPQRSSRPAIFPNPKTCAGC